MGMLVWARLVFTDLKTQVSGWFTQQVNQRNRNMLPVLVVALPFLHDVTWSHGKSQRLPPCDGLVYVCLSSEMEQRSPSVHRLQWLLLHSLPYRDSSLVAGVWAGGCLPWTEG